MEILNTLEVQKVTGGAISFGEAVAMGGFSGGAGAAAAGAGIGVVASATVAGSLLVGAGYAGYSFGTAIGLGGLGRRMGSWIYDATHKQH